MDVDLHACIHGDKDAWDAFVRRWAPVIYAAAQRVLGARRDEVDDTVQDVFVRLIKDDSRLLRSFDPNRASLSTWLTLVARSTAIDRARRRRSEALPIHEHEGALPAVEDIPPGGSGEPVPLHLLTSRQRLVLHLLFDRQLDVAEAARFLDVDDQTVRSTKHKALARLRAHFSDPPRQGDAGGSISVQPHGEQP